jgi:beta-phosphoglucomutase
MRRRTGAIFDLDGVLVDTARFHYECWKRLAAEFGFELTLAQNEALKGIPRMESLEMLLSIGGIRATAGEKAALAEKKNAWYRECLMRLNRTSALPGALEFVSLVRRMGVRTAIASASRNTTLVVDRLGIAGLFDAIVDGTMVARQKPDPAAFLAAAAALRLEPADCAVFEDAAAGVAAAKAGGMLAVGIGSAENLPGADIVAPGLNMIRAETLF